MASAIGKMDGMRGYRGWRWVFILGKRAHVPIYPTNVGLVEGTLTAVVGIIFFFLISDFPEETKWLSSDERDFVKARLIEDVGDSQRHSPLKVRDVFNIIKECK